MTFSRVGNTFGFCNVLVVQPRHTQNACRIKLISMSACFLLAVTSGCYFFGNYHVLQLLHLLPFLYSFSSIFMQMFKFLSHLVEVFFCLSSHFSSCNTLTVLLFYINSCSYVLTELLLLGRWNMLVWEMNSLGEIHLGFSQVDSSVLFLITLPSGETLRLLQRATNAQLWATFTHGELQPELFQCCSHLVPTCLCSWMSFGDKLMGVLEVINMRSSSRQNHTEPAEVNIRRGTWSFVREV